MVDIRKEFYSNGIFARGFLVLLLLISPIEFGFSPIILRIEFLVGWKNKNQGRKLTSASRSFYALAALHWST